MGDEDMGFEEFWDDAEEFERDALCRDRDFDEDTGDL